MLVGFDTDEQLFGDLPHPRPLPECPRTNALLDKYLPRDDELRQQVLNSNENYAGMMMLTLLNREGAPCQTCVYHEKSFDARTMEVTRGFDLLSHLTLKCPPDAIECARLVHFGQVLDEFQPNEARDTWTLKSFRPPFSPIVSQVTLNLEIQLDLQHYYEPCAVSLHAYGHFLDFASRDRLRVADVLEFTLSGDRKARLVPCQAIAVEHTR